MDLKALLKTAQEMQGSKVEAVEAVSKGFRISLEFFGLLILIFTFTKIPLYWNIGSFIIGAFLFIRGRQLE